MKYVKKRTLKILHLNGISVNFCCFIIGDLSPLLPEPVTYSQCCSAEIYTCEAVLLKYNYVRCCSAGIYKSDAGTGDPWEWRPQTAQPWQYKLLCYCSLNICTLHYFPIIYLVRDKCLVFNLELCADLIVSAAVRRSILVGGSVDSNFSPRRKNRTTTLLLN